jgi:D-alanine--poly(phosphoribitol) ligase subunit 1
VDALDLMLRHAVDRPDAVALKDGRGPLSYADLLEQVKSSAAGLAQLGVRSGDRVALWLPNSAAFLVTALGCLWLGAAFVPLSMDDPPSRLARAVADCDPTAIVVPGGRQRLDPPAVFGGRRLVDTLSLLESGERAPRQERDPERDAYLIYTSGTTGSPKGVRIPERAFRMAISNAANLLGLDATTRTLCVPPFHFDGAYGSAFPTLVAGGSLVVPRRERLLFVKPFFTALLEEGITHTGFTPTYLRLVLSTPWSRSLIRCNLRTLGLGGEECVAADVARLWKLHPTLRVFNRYGPTETTIQVTTYEIDRKDVASGTVPIGPPHPGVSFHIVAEDGQLVRGHDETGELWIGGNQLMRGYWGDKELTSRMLRDDVVPGTTVYRSGDLVYRDVRGRFVCVGRTDSLVKRNGVRVSLSEIARVLRGANGVSDAVCLPVDKGGRLAIAAFVETRSDVTVSQILKVAHRELPTGMVPDEVHLRTSFPCNSSGKVDGHRLVANAQLAMWSTDRDNRQEAAGTGDPGSGRNSSTVV